MAVKKYRIAIIGCGMICNAAHIPSILELKKQGMAEIVAVADIRECAARETAQRWEIPAWYDDPQRMLDEVKPDWVSVCTPNVYHKQWSIAALRSGAHVRCEKPLALTYMDAKEMFAEADKAGKLLWACQSRRWSADMDFAYQAMREGDIGKPYFADISFVRRYGIPTWGFFHMKQHNGGGAFCDLGVHFVDALLWMCGSPRVKAVSGMETDVLARKKEDILLSIKESGAYIGTFTPRPYDPDEFSVEECSAGTIRLEGGFLVNFKFTWALNQPTKKRFLLCGDKGGLDVEQFKLYKNVGKFQAETELKYFDNRPFAGVAFDAHRYMYRHVYDVLEGKVERLVKPEETLNVVSAIEAFYLSAEQDREVRTTELKGYES